MRQSLPAARRCGRRGAKDRTEDRTECPAERAGSPLRRLSGQDGGFLVLELPEQPMQTIVLALLRPGPEGPVQVVGVQRHLAARLHELPAFRWRVVPVPLGLSHPVFVEDPAFDLARHVRHAVLPEPGGDGDARPGPRSAQQRRHTSRPNAPGSARGEACASSHTW